MKNNNFSGDDYNERLARLQMLSSNIDNCYIEIGLPDDYHVWAKNSADEYNVFLFDRNQNKYHSMGLTDKFNKSFKSAREIYVRAKELLLSFINQSSIATELADEYDVNGICPRTFGEFNSSVTRFERAFARHKALGDGYVVPDALEAAVVAARDDAADLLQEAMEQRQKASASLDSLRARFDSDTAKLRIVYQFAIATWGKRGLKLDEIGFAPRAESVSGWHPAPPDNLHYDSEESAIAWDATEGATSYQLEVSANGKKWKNVYTGTNNYFGYTLPAEKQYARARGRNKHGYGNWSVAELN